MSNSSANGDGSSSSGSGNNNKRPIDPILRNALRYTVSAKEYKVLHEYLISRAPAIRKRTPQPRRYEAIVDCPNDYNVATVRLALRLFAGSYIALKGWETILYKVQEWRQTPLSHGRKAKSTAVAPGRQGTNFRTSASLALILLFHRLLHRFLLRLRASLLEVSARPFRRRNPRIAMALTSAYTPAIGAALSGLCLGVCPASQLRTGMAIYVFTRALEFGYNAAEDKGVWGKTGKPDWVGSWMIMPFAFGQLLHAFVFDRECFPENFGPFILNRSPEYIQHKPDAFPENTPWPSGLQIVDGLADLSRLRWPAFVSPILFPAAKQPATLAHLAVITSPAHPAIRNTSCALLHPRDPSCTRTYLKYFLAAFPAAARLFALIYGVSAMFSWKLLLSDPMNKLNALASRVLRMSLFMTGAIGTAWGSICLFANYLPRNVLATQRWFLSGFLGGLWAILARRGERGNFLYSARLSLDSLWKVGVKRGWWKGIKGGDVLLFTASLALIDVLHATRPTAVKGAMIRRGMDVLRGEVSNNPSSQDINSQKHDANAPVDDRDEAKAE